MSSNSAFAGQTGQTFEPTRPDHGHEVSPTEIAIGVVIGRSSEAFDFFVFAIAAVLVFPARFFPFADPLTGTLYGFLLLAVAFLARPLGTAIFTEVAIRHGKGAKLTLALFLMGSATVAMGLVPSYDTIGGWSIFILLLLRVGQGIALGGAWDGLASLLALNAPEGKRGFYAMIPQLGAPVGLMVATLLFAFLSATLSPADFIDWGWRYPFFVAFAINVVALFARLRIVVTPEYSNLFETRELEPAPVGEVLRANAWAIVAAAFVPLASFALFHMVSVFPLSWVMLNAEESMQHFLRAEGVGALVMLVAVYVSGLISDRVGRRNLLIGCAVLIGAFALFAPVSLGNGDFGVNLYLMLGFALLGVTYGQCSGAVAGIFDPQYRYTSSAITSDLAWLFGAGFAPFVALALAAWLGLFYAGLYLLSGAVVSLAALIWAGRRV